jgi:hypothetical protein
VFMLLELRDLLRARGVEVVLAGKRHLIEQWRRKRGLAEGDVDGMRAVRLFTTLEDAVEAFAVAPVSAVAREPGLG